LENATTMNSTLSRFGRRIRLALIGGGPGSFIGPVHRAAARFEDRFEFVAGVLSSDPERSRRYGLELGLAPDRAYPDAAAFFAGERSREDGVDAVAIMTPNDSHYPLARAAIEAGMDIICDKPLTTSLKDALELERRVRESGLVFCHTFNYSGYPLVRQARAMARDGDLGEIRLVQVEYVYGNSADLVEGELGDPPKHWHYRPQNMGPSLILPDIGSHAHHMARFVTGLEFDRLIADVATIVPGRKSDDHASLLFRMSNGAHGVMWITQSAAGGVNGLTFRVFGARGGVVWRQETPNQLHHLRHQQPETIYERRGPGLKPQALRACHVAMGHPEGYQEAFAVLYAEAAEAIVSRRLGEAPRAPLDDMPTVFDGVQTMKFVEAALASSRDGRWMRCETGA
jgi:predicted dehydrogenase